MNSLVNSSYRLFTRLPVLAVLTCLSLAWSLPLQGGTSTWISTPENDSWTNTENWNSFSLPSAGDTIILNDVDGGDPITDIVDSPAETFGGVTFSSDTNYAYSLSGDGIFSGDASVEDSSSGFTHIINMAYTTDGVTFDVEGTDTSLSLSNISYSGGSTSFTKSGVGTLFITNTSDGAGLLNLSEGTVDIQASVGQSGNFRLSSTNADAVFTNSGGSTITATIGGEDSGGESASYAGQLSGAVDIQLGTSGGTAGTGVTQTFTSDSVNTYTGSTNVVYGTLLVNGSHTGGDSYSVFGLNATSTDGPTLGGTGTIELTDDAKTFLFGGLSETTAATLAPGESDSDTEMLTLGSSSIETEVFLNAYSILEIDLGESGQSDSVMIYGDIVITETDTELLLNSLTGAFDGSTYTILTYTGTLTGTFANISGLDSLYIIDYGSGSNDAITLTIPEPTSGALLAGGLALAALRRRRRA